MAGGARAPVRRAARAALAAIAMLALGAAPGAAAPTEDCVAVDDFAGTAPGEFPPAWTVRSEAGRGVYAVAEEDGRRFLRAASRGHGVQAARKLEWDLEAYPVLAWSWRPREFPRGGDERRSATNDSALAVYAVFPHTPWSVRAVKYVWSAVVPFGTRLESSRGLTQVLVLRTGTDRTGRWVEERVDVREDVKRLFRFTEAPAPVGIAVLTDSDDTRSSAAGDYADFRVCRAAAAPAR